MKQITPFTASDSRKKVNFSRRIDAAENPDWLLERLREGVAYGVNPFTGKPYRVGLRQDEVKLLILWTKAPASLTSYVEQFTQLGYEVAMFVSINNYAEWLEPNVPQLPDIISGVENVGRIIGSGRVWWRYDPIIPTDLQDLQWHKIHFAHLCELLHGLTTRCVSSMVNITGSPKYKASGEALSLAAREAGQELLSLTRQEKLQFVGELSTVIEDFMGIKLEVCCHPFLDNSCVSKSQQDDNANLLSKEGQKLIAAYPNMTPSECISSSALTAIGIHGDKRDGGFTVGSTRKGNIKHEMGMCQCRKSVDIGGNISCSHGCVYCQWPHGRGKNIEKTRIPATSLWLSKKPFPDEVIIENPANAGQLTHPIRRTSMREGNMEQNTIRTTPGLTKAGKPFDFHERRMVEKGAWRLELVPAAVLGLCRPLEIYRAERKSKFVVSWDRDNAKGYCPLHWADIKIGQDACGLRCRCCFLISTHRTLANPSRHILYENTDECVQQVKRWLKKPNRRSLGLGIDCSDSLLYEGVTGYARKLIPLIASSVSNPYGVKLILLTKTSNVRCLCGLPGENVIVTFSLNPESIADLWEGKFDDGVRVTPSIKERVEASAFVADMGFETRWRIDPILNSDGWEDLYKEFFLEAAKLDACPVRITLGTYRETSRSLHTMAASWGLSSMEYKPSSLVKEGMHYHVPAEIRTGIYRKIAGFIRATWLTTGHVPEIALCKEPPAIRQAVGLDHDLCNCG